MPTAGRTMPYDWIALPEGLKINWWVYELMIQEYAGGLANAVNQLTFYERSLRAWSIVIDGLPEEKRYPVAHEFVDATATVAINLPYVIRERFAFTAAHLCHQANQLKLSPWTDDLPRDSSINPTKADRYGEPWDNYAEFKQCLDRISGQDYKDNTGDFRNIYTHRFQPHFVFGLSQTVTRKVGETGGIRYDFGWQLPLQLGDVAAQLATQRDRCYAAFDAFQGLVREHVDFIGRHARR